MEYNEFLGAAIINWCNDHGVRMTGHDKCGFTYLADGEPEHYMTFDRFQEAA